MVKYEVLMECIFEGKPVYVGDVIESNNPQANDLVGMKRFKLYVEKVKDKPSKKQKVSE